MADVAGAPALAALLPVVAYDKSLISEPARIRAALLDLAGEDQSGIDQVVLSVRLGIPQLVTVGDLAGAQLRLVDVGGMRVDVAKGITGAWRAALSVPGRSDDESDGELYQVFAAVLPGAPLRSVGPADCHVWPDGVVTITVLGLDGINLATLRPSDQSASVTWHQIATPNAPLSRAAILASVTDARAVVFWTDNSGLWSRPLRRQGSGPIEVADARIVDAPDHGQARYPMSALAVDGSEIDVFWTIDRREIQASTRTNLGTIERRLLPSPCDPGERLTSLDCAVASETTAWLVALSDRGRLFTARWDVPGGDHDGWRLVSTPYSGMTSMTVVMLSAGASILVGDPQGDVATIDAATAYSGAGYWRPLKVLAPSNNLAGLTSLSASSHGDIAFAVATTAKQLHLIRLQRYGEVAEALGGLVLN